VAKANKQSASGEASKERPILHKVLAGLIVAGLLWLATYIPGLWQALSTGFTWCWGKVIQDISLPAWALGPLVIGDIVLVLALVGKILSWHRANSGPSWTDYTKDDFYGMVWRWDYSPIGGAITGLCCFCPRDDTVLVWIQSHDLAVERETTFRCETCGIDFGTMRGYSWDIEGKVKRQIDRKLRTGEWKDVLVGQRKKQDES